MMSSKIVGAFDPNQLCRLSDVLIKKGLTRAFEAHRLTSKIRQS